MPNTTVLFYAESDGRAPVVEFLSDLERRDERAFLKCRVKMERLAEMGHELRRPEADRLRDGIYELRARQGSVNYRILYFFAGRQVAVLGLALTKEQAVPKTEIETAIRRREAFFANPKAHTYTKPRGDTQ